MTRTIPIQVQCDLDKMGGILGLKKALPKKKEILKVILIAKGISELNRISILNLLEKQPLCVCVIKKILGVTDSKLSYHLNILSRCGLVTRKKEKNFIIYDLTKLGRKVLRNIGSKY